MNRQQWIWFWRGALIGLANLLPGISGGTVAVLFNYYTELIDAVRRLDWPTLVWLVLGGAVSIVGGSHLIVTLLQILPNYTQAAIVGLILASALILVCQISNQRRPSAWLPFGVGFLLILAIKSSLVPPVGLANTLPFWRYGLLGAIGSLTMLLPGISGATVLVLLGQYEHLLAALADLKLTILLPFGLGGLIGMVSFASGINYLLKHFRSIILSFFAGLILASIILVQVRWSAGSLLAAGLSCIGATWFLRGRR